jgi:hypothetical protein
VFESEDFSEQQAEQQITQSDTSTAATFNSAFNEAASGGSDFQTQSDSSSWGGSIILVGGGSGSSSSSGEDSQWLQGQRRYAKPFAQVEGSRVCLSPRNAALRRGPGDR